jgi:hypothetical protein
MFNYTQPNEFVYLLLNFKGKKRCGHKFVLLGVKFFIMATKKIEFFFLKCQLEKKLENFAKVWIVIKTLVKVGLMKDLSLF